MLFFVLALAAEMAAPERAVFAIPEPPRRRGPRLETGIYANTRMRVSVANKAEHIGPVIVESIKFWGDKACTQRVNINVLPSCGPAGCSFCSGYDPYPGNQAWTHVEPSYPPALGLSIQNNPKYDDLHAAPCQNAFKDYRRRFNPLSTLKEVFGVGASSTDYQRPESTVYMDGGNVPENPTGNGLYDTLSIRHWDAPTKTCTNTLNCGRDVEGKPGVTHWRCNIGVCHWSAHASVDIIFRPNSAAAIAARSRATPHWIPQHPTSVMKIGGQSSPDWINVFDRYQYYVGDIWAVAEFQYSPEISCITTQGLPGGPQVQVQWALGNTNTWTSWTNVLPGTPDQVGDTAEMSYNPPACIVPEGCRTWERCIPSETAPCMSCNSGYTFVGGTAPCCAHDTYLGTGADGLPECKACIQPDNCHLATTGRGMCSTGPYLTCEQCEDGFYLDNNQCHACTPMAGCDGQVTCTSSITSSCSQCGAGQYRTADGQCPDCVENTANCATYEASCGTQPNPTEKRCTLCNSGFWLWLDPTLPKPSCYDQPCRDADVDYCQEYEPCVQHQTTVQILSCTNCLDGTTPSESWPNYVALPDENVRNYLVDGQCKSAKQVYALLTSSTCH